MTNSTDNICVAELKSAYGIKGWLWLYANTDPMQAIFDYSTIFIIENGVKKPVKFENWRKQGKGLVVKLTNVNDRNAAELLVNTKIWLHKSDLPELKEDEFYWSDLISLNVVSENETTGELQMLGTVKQFFETSAHQIMEVIPTNNSVDDETRLIPWHDSTIIDVDTQNKQIKTTWQVDY